MADFYFNLPAAPVVLPAWLITVVVATASLLGRRLLTPARLLTVLVASTYGAVLAAATLFPFRVVFGGYVDTVAWYDKINLIPLVTADPTGFILNIAMTVPLGLLAPLVFRVRSARAAVLLGLGVSGTIELIQGFCGIVLGGARTGDVNDVIANTAGTVLGFLLLQLLMSVEKGRLVERLTLEPANH